MLLHSSHGVRLHRVPGLSGGGGQVSSFCMCCLLPTSCPPLTGSSTRRRRSPPAVTTVPRRCRHRGSSSTAPASLQPWAVRSWAQLGTGEAAQRFLFLAPAPGQGRTHMRGRSRQGAGAGRRNLCTATTVPTQGWHPAHLLSTAPSWSGTGVALGLPACPGQLRIVAAPCQVPWCFLLTKPSFHSPMV